MVAIVLMLQVYNFKNKKQTVFQSICFITLSCLTLLNIVSWVIQTEKYQYILYQEIMLNWFSYLRHPKYYLSYYW